MTRQPALAPDQPLFAAEEVSKRYRNRGASGHTLAVDHVSLRIGAGESLGLVGESGSGKSTFGRLVVGLERPSAGTCSLDGQPVPRVGSRRHRKSDRRIQMIFQSPRLSLNPYRKVGQLVADACGMAPGEPGDPGRRARDLFERVGLAPGLFGRYPHSLSSGQCQRVAIARALASNPRLIVADEPTSALDVSVQAQVLNLLHEVVAARDLAMLFISHDVRAVSFLCERIAVFYRGQLVEVAARTELVTAPRHPYTRALVSAVPGVGRPAPDAPLAAADATRVSGGGPATGTGCAYASRCDLRQQLGNPEICRSERPAVIPLGTGFVACHFAVASSAPTAAG